MSISNSIQGGSSFASAQTSASPHFGLKWRWNKKNTQPAPETALKPGDPAEATLKQPVPTDQVAINPDNTTETDPEQPVSAEPEPGDSSTKKKKNKIKTLKDVKNEVQLAVKVLNAVKNVINAFNTVVLPLVLPVVGGIVGVKAAYSPSSNVRLNQIDTYWEMLSVMDAINANELADFEILPSADNNEVIIRRVEPTEETSESEEKIIATDSSGLSFRIYQNDQGEWLIEPVLEEEPAESEPTDIEGDAQDTIDVNEEYQPDTTVSRQEDSTSRFEVR